MALNPFYAFMPEWFRFIGIIIATAAAIIASQALISGSFTLISEAMRLNLWPKMKINYPTEEKGQLFIPAVNMLLFLRLFWYCTVFSKNQPTWKQPMVLPSTICMMIPLFCFQIILLAQRLCPLWIYLYLFVYLLLNYLFLLPILKNFIMEVM